MKKNLALNFFKSTLAHEIDFGHNNAIVINTRRHESDD